MHGVGHITFGANVVAMIALVTTENAWASSQFVRDSAHESAQRAADRHRRETPA
jgi:hypothetical protein